MRAVKVTWNIKGTGRDYISVSRLCQCHPPIISQALRSRAGIQRGNLEFWGREFCIEAEKHMYSVSHFEYLWGMKRHNTRQGEIPQDVYLALLYEQKPHGVWSKWGTSTWNYTGHCPYSVTWSKAQMNKQEVDAEHPWSNLFHLGARGQEWRSWVGGKDSSWRDPACCSQSLGSGFASPAESCSVNVCSKSHGCVPTQSRCHFTSRVTLS